MTQAEKLINAGREDLIDATCVYFESQWDGGAPVSTPEGVTLKETYTRTMGRYFDGEKMVNY